MKKLTSILLLFFCITVSAQFNTVMPAQKPADASIQIKPVTNQFSNNENYTLYNLTGKPKNAKPKQRSKNNRPKDDSNDNHQNIAEEKTQKVDEPVALSDNHQNTENKSVIYKKLPLLEEPLERQRVYMPLNIMRITSPYGMRIHPVEGIRKMHNGIDLAAQEVAVFAVLNGIVDEAGYTSLNGNYLKIKHDGGFETYYLHLDRFYYKAGDRVSAGNIIAISGNTGESTAPHLHFAVKEDGRFIDPVKFLNDLIITNNTLIDYENRQLTNR